jgi:hypothetical protein
MGFDYFDEAGDDLIKNSFLVALHGSTDKDLAKGYRIVIARKGKRLQDFMSGFLQNKKVSVAHATLCASTKTRFFFPTITAAWFIT